MAWLSLIIKEIVTWSNVLVNSFLHEVMFSWLSIASCIINQSIYTLEKDKTKIIICRQVSFIYAYRFRSILSLFPPKNLLVTNPHALYLEKVSIELARWSFLFFFFWKYIFIFVCEEPWKIENVCMVLSTKAQKRHNSVSY